MSAKNPRNPIALKISTDDIRSHATSDPIYRIHTVQGQHPMPWNGLREVGPLPQMRWDPQPLPRGLHSGIGVAYCATDPTTAFAEVFQSRRKVRLNADQSFTAWYPTRPLRLLDLTGIWATRNGASASLHAAPKSTCRAWSRGIHSHPITPPLDGLYVPSTLTLRPMVVLFSTAEAAFPSAPHFSGLLTHAKTQVLAVKAAHELSWPLI